MIHLDLSKPPSLRLFVYLLALFPGLFFLMSIALGNPPLAKSAIQQVAGIYPFSPYVLALILVGAGFAIGQAASLLAWLIELALIGLYHLPRVAFRKIFGGTWLYVWFAKFQGMPPKNTFVVRTLGKIIQSARMEPPDTAEARAMRFCLMAATERLLKKRYGIGKLRANGPNGMEWYLWSSVLGNPVKPVIENRNLGRVLLACGVAGFLSIRFAPGLKEPYYLSLCATFALTGLWAALWLNIQFKNPVWRDGTRLRSILLELQEFSRTQKMDGPTNTKPAGKGE
jgi:hypothetical protein